MNAKTIGEKPGIVSLPLLATLDIVLGRWIEKEWRPLDIRRMEMANIGREYKMLVVNRPCSVDNMNQLNTCSHGEGYLNGEKYKTDWVTHNLCQAKFQPDFQTMPISS